MQLQSVFLSAGLPHVTCTPLVITDYSKDARKESCYHHVRTLGSVKCSLRDVIPLGKKSVMRRITITVHVCPNFIAVSQKQVLLAQLNVSRKPP